jgi:ABC-type transporter Mla subunit MlaD
MSLKYLVAVLAIAALPVCAQAQQKAQPAQPAPPPAAPKPTKAAAQKVIQIISTDKAKTKLYCDIAALSEQIDAASQKKDEKKVDELAQQAEDMGSKIGPEFVALMDGLQDMNPESKESEEIGNMLEALDKLCAKK